MQKILTLALLFSLTGCSSIGQMLYDSAKTEECRRQGINHCDPYDQSKPIAEGALIEGSSENSNEALEAKSKQVRKQR